MVDWKQKLNLFSQAINVDCVWVRTCITGFIVICIPAIPEPSKPAKGSSPVPQSNGISHPAWYYKTPPRSARDKRVLQNAGICGHKITFNVIWTSHILLHSRNRAMSPMSCMKRPSSACSRRLISGQSESPPPGFLYSAQCKRRNANGATQVAQRKWQTATLTLTLTLTHLRCAICIAPFALRRIQIAPPPATVCASAPSVLQV